MKHIYKYLFSMLMAVMALTQANTAQAACASTRGSDFSYGNKCMTYSFEAKNLQNGCLKYSWKFINSNGGVVTADGRVTSYTFPANGNYYARLLVSDTCKKCDTVIYKSITVNCNTCSWSGMTFSYGNKCRDYTFEGKNFNNGCLKYQFYVFANGATIALTPGRVASYSFSATGSYTVKMIVKDTCKNCDTFVYQTIKVDCNPCNLNPEFSWKNDCLKAKFIAGGNVSGATYSWSFGDGSYGKGGDPAHAYYKSGTYKVCMEMNWTDPNTGQKCSKSICKEIKISCGRDCNIKGDFSFKAVSGQVKFNAYSNNGYYYSWSFGDGTYGTGKDPIHQYKKPGTYKVCVKITDKTKKCTVTICKTVVIEEPCRVKVAFAYLQGNGNLVKFVGLAFGGSKFVWDFGDGTTGYGNDPSHTYGKPGVYKVCLTVYSNNGKCKTTLCKTVEVKGTTKGCNWAAMGAGFSYAVNCPKLVLEAKNLNNSCISYGWSVTPAGTNQSTTFYGRVQTITFNSSGTFKVCLKMYDSCHKCDTLICKEIKVDCNTSKCNWSAENPYFGVWDSCKMVYGYIGFNSSRSGCFKYTWKVNGVAVSHDKYLNYAIKENGKYSFCVNVMDTCHNCDTTFCGTANITCFKTCNWKSKYPNYVNFTAGANCKTITAGMNTSGAGCIRQYYYLAGVAAAYDGKLYHSWTVDKNGTYVVCIKLVDTCTGCDTTLCKEVKVDCNKCDMSKASFTYKIDCNKVTVEGYNMGGCNTYGFSWGDGTASSYNRVADHRYTKNGTYTLCYKVYDTCSKCDTTICKSITISCQPCSAQASFKVDSTNTAGVAYITNTSTGGYSYVWDYGDSTYSYYKSPGKHAYSASGGYTICLTVYDSSKSCSTKYCLQIKIVKSRAASVAEQSTQHVQVYPNPTSDKFNIAIETGLGTYMVYNVQGQIITSGTLAGTTEVDTHNWSEGIYIVKTQVNGSNTTSRIVITKQ